MTVREEIEFDLHLYAAVTPFRHMLRSVRDLKISINVEIFYLYVKRNICKICVKKKKRGLVCKELYILYYFFFFRL